MDSTKSSPAPFGPGNNRSFPKKLFSMLEDADSMGFSDIVTWQPNGKSFKVLQPKKFVSGVMQEYFNQTKYKSFQRQLNIYGFQKVQYGPDKGSYSHPFLQKSKPELVGKINRQFAPEKNKEVIKLASSATPCPLPLSNDIPMTKAEIINPNSLLQEQQFFFEVSTPPFQVQALHDENDFQIIDLEAQFFADIFEENFPSKNGSLGSTEFNSLESIHGCQPESDAIAIDSTLQEISSIVDSVSFDDDEPLSLEMIYTNSCQNDDIYKNNSNTSEHVFPWRLHTMLEDASKNGFQNIVSWVEEGAAFKVHDPQSFVEKIMPSYFDQTKYESFRRQLNLYGFTRVTRGVKRGIYFHEFFLESDRSLCRNMNRGCAGSSEKN